jgi:hypothetical protein
MAGWLGFADYSDVLAGVADGVVRKAALPKPFRLRRRSS